MKRAFLLASPFLLMMTACGNGSDVVSDANPITDNQDNEFQLFADSVYREPESGIYLVDGDTPVGDLKKLEEFWQLHVREGELIVNQSNGHDTIWSASQRKALTYCVSKKFTGARYQAVIDAMASATAEWAAAADIKFVHLAELDATCTKTSDVVFDVNPVNVGGQYIARSFFPDSTRAERNVLIDNSAFTASGDPTLTGVLRHELGHTLGFRHEHTRPESGACFEDDNWRELTAYDKASVMHYPQCNGISSWALVLTDKDKAGAASLYGAPGGDNGGDDNGDNGGDDDNAPPQSSVTTETFSGAVAKKAWSNLNPDGGWSVAGGTTVTVTMSGSGDPDLYVRFDGRPETNAYTCRPYRQGAAETCELDVPAGGATLFVGVRGYSAGNYDVSVTYTAN